MNFKKWVKSIQTAGYNGARTVLYIGIFCINVAGAESFSGAWNENEKKVEIIKEMTSRDDWKTMHAWLGLSALI